MFKSIRQLAQPSVGKVMAAVVSPRLPSDCAGYLEVAVCNQQDGFACVAGWAASGTLAKFWLEDASGHKVDLDSGVRVSRQDLLDSDHPALGRIGGVGAGFICGFPNLPAGSKVALKVQVDGHVSTAHEIATSNLPGDPTAAFKLLLGLYTPRSQYSKRFQRVDWPVIGPILRAKQTRHAELPVESHWVGAAVNSPSVSIIIPLYKRFDFVEPQLLKFSRDPWLCQYAEIIYVLDDPELVDVMRTEAATLYGLYRVSFRWVWGGANRGYAGANNLGVQHAVAKHFIFLNSDVFPIQSGWASRLVDVLSAFPDVGAVAPRLLHADGSVQHAGMAFQYTDEFGIWTNEHPGRGIDALELPATPQPTPVDAVTGACLAVRRDDLSRVGGWDTGYLIGDFEDSDLCLKMSEVGLKSVCLQTETLVHLERQSFAALGEPAFRTAVVILNATRHQTRWLRYLEVSVGRGQDQEVLV